MSTKQDRLDDDEARRLILDYVKARPGQNCQEADIKLATGVPKVRVRSLMRGVSGIDPAELEMRAVCWNPTE